MPIKNNNKKKGGEDKKIFKSAKTAKKGGEGEQSFNTVNKLINISVDPVITSQYLANNRKLDDKFNKCITAIGSTNCCLFNEFSTLPKCQTQGGKAKPKSKVTKKK